MNGIFDRCLDLGIIAVFLIAIFSVAISNRFKFRDIRDFSVGDRNYPTPVLLASLFSCLICGLTTIGLPGLVFSYGLWPVIGLLGIGIQEVLIASFVAPKMARFSGMVSVGDIMGSLYGENIKVLTGLASIFSNIFFLGAQQCAFGFFIQYCFHISFDVAILILSSILIPYAALGGVQAVRKTNVLHFCMIILALPMVAVMALSKVGGFQALVAALPSDHFTLSIFDPAAPRFLGICLLFAVPALYPIVVQRMLMCRDMQQARRMLLLKAGLMTMFLVVPLSIGLVAYLIAPSIEPKSAFSYVVNNLLPVGIKGLAMTGMLAMIMSTTDSFLNSIAISIAHDVLKPLRKTFLSANAELIVARFSTVLAGVLIALCAILSRDIFFGFIGSMNIWLPFFFPPLFLGILGFGRNQGDLWYGASSAAIVWITVARLTSWGNSWIILSATAASVVTILIRHLYYRWTASKPIPVLSSSKKTELIKRKPEYALFASLTLASAMLPFFFWSYHGDEIDGVSFSIYLVAALLCLALLLKDYFSWLSKSYWFYHWHVALLFCLPFISGFTVVQSQFSPFWIFDSILVGFLLWVFAGKRVYWPLLSIGVFGGGLLADIHTQSCHLNLNGFWLPQMSFILHVLSLGTCFIVFRKQDSDAVVAVKTLSDTMAHSFQAPLSEFSMEAKILKQALPILLDSYRKNSPRNQSITEKRLAFLETIPEKMERNATRLQTNIEMILGKIDLKKGGSASEWVFINPSIRAVIDAVPQAISWSSGMDLRFWGRSDIFELLLLELLKNASEAIQTAGQGAISIQLHPQTRELWIEDTAGGIPAYLIDQIFEQRFTTKRTGTGLGLYFCKLVLNDWGGDIRCVSEEGAWTRFIVLLPEDPS